MRFAARCSLVIGALMLVQWSFFLAAGQVAELDTEPIRLAFHLAAEAVTAVALIVAGVDRAARARRSRVLGRLARPASRAGMVPEASRTVTLWAAARHTAWLAQRACDA